MYFWLSFLGLIGLYSCSASQGYFDPHCGGRQVIVHLFEWRWEDVAAECERYLGPKGFCGVQVSPPNENAVVKSNPSRPWWERYQPVSYHLNTRSGDEKDFKDMVDRCKAVDVRIYADVVINHMAGSDRKGLGTGGTNFDGATGDFPGVPFSADNFHSASDCGARGDINYQVSSQVRNCDLLGLRDLDYSQSYVLNKVAAYLNKLIDLGVAGFRVDAAKHMWPDDISALQKKLQDLPEGGKPFFCLEVIDFDSEAVKDREYFSLGYVTEFRYHQKVKDGVSSFNRLKDVQDAGWSMVPSDKALVFVDNHDTQRQMGTLNYKRGDQYKRAVAFTLANDYGLVRVMSSFSFRRKDEGPPHEADYSIKSVSINSDGTCGNGWVCEHRWNMIGNLARFRTAVHGEKVTNWVYRNRVLSFSRGHKGFFAMSRTDFTVTRYTGLPAGEYCDLISDCAMTVLVDTKGSATFSPAHSSEPFVAIITEEKANQTDSLNTKDSDSGSPKVQSKDKPVGDAPSPPVQVSPTVFGDVTLDHTTQDPVRDQEPKQISVPKPRADNDRKGKLPIASNSNSSNVSKQPDAVAQNGSDFRRTVIVIERETRPGQNVFIRGGLESSLTSGCTWDVQTSPCSIPIRHFQDYSDDDYLKLNSWRKGDHFLDWNGAEPKQDTFLGKQASGTPAFLSTTDNDPSGISNLIEWGDYDWIVDIEMDCARTQNGYFQVRALVNGLMERRFRQAVGPCKGDGAPATVPFESKYHIGRCGYLNLFTFGMEECQILDLL